MKAFERSVLADSCGCAMGARFMVATLIVAGAWYGRLYYGHTLGAWHVALRVFVAMMLATLVGKTIGLVLHRQLSRRVERGLVSPSTR